MVIEMIDGEPPYFNETPTDAMMITKRSKSPPKIKHSEKVSSPPWWSGDPGQHFGKRFVDNIFQVSQLLHNFVDRMLVRRPEDRATAADLLRHPFMRKARDADCLIPLIMSKRQR